MHEKLTPNNQDILTTNTDQPNRRFSDGQPPALPDTLVNATTGCTTLPSDTDIMATEFDPIHQSAKAEMLDRSDPHTASTTSEAYQQSVSDWRSATGIFAVGQPISEKDPPAPSPDVYIKDFNTPQERVVPDPNKNYIDIIFASVDSPEFIEVEDADGKSISIGAWIQRKNDFALRIPDPRQVQPLKDQILALTAQNQRNAEISNLDQLSIRELRGANTTLLRKITELRDTNRDLAKERHALAAALLVANETMSTSIERILSLIQVIK